MTNDIQRISFCTSACFPQVPSVASVRIALGQTEGVTEADRCLFEFCEANSLCLVDNARRCAESLLRQHEGRRTSFEEAEIVFELMAMVVSRVPGKNRCDLIEQLMALPAWDEHQVCGLLMDILREAAAEREAEREAEEREYWEEQAAYGRNKYEEEAWWNPPPGDDPWDD